MPEAATVRDLRRGQIVAEARALVAEEGLSALTFGALEARLAFTRGVITYHFRNKDEIVEAVLQSAIEEIDAATVAAVGLAADPASRVAESLRATVRGFLEHPEATRILIGYWSRIPHDRRVTDLNARMYARWRRLSAAILTRGVQTGVFRDIGVDAAAGLMVSVVIGTVTQAYFEADCIDLDAVVDVAVAGLLRALAPELPRPRQGR